MASEKSKQVGASLIMALAAFIWGTSFVAQSKGLELIGNYTFLAFRSYLAVAALLPVAIITYKKGKKTGEGEHGEYKSFFSKKLLLGGAACGVIIFTSSALQQTGIIYSGVGKSGFLTTLYILLVPLIGLIFKRKVKPILWVCIGIAVVGMYFLCVTDASGGISFGDIMLILCALGFSIHITTIDYFVKIVDGIRMSLLQFCFCAVISTVAMLIFEDVSLADVWGAGFALFYSGVMSAGVAFTLQIVSQKNLNPTVASLIMSLESVFAALSGAVFGERLSYNEIFGCCLVFTAIVISQLPTDAVFKRKTKKS